MSELIQNFSNTCFYIGVIATILFLLKTFIPVDLGTEVSGDFNAVSDVDTSFNIFSIESILAFFMCFGWIAWFCNHNCHYSKRLSLLIAIIFGIIGMLLFAFLIFQFKKLEHVVPVNYAELVNKTGKAYIKFAPNATSKIQIEINGKLDILDATNISDSEINSFETIKVVKYENDILYIEKA